MKASQKKIIDTPTPKNALLTSVLDTLRQTRIEMERPGLPPVVTELAPQEWRETPSKNVVMRVCSLDQFTDNQTVCNVAVNPMRLAEGGTIGEHTHDRFERIFVVEGGYVDSVSGVTYKEGSTQEIAPHQPHGLESQFALLFVTWRPAYPRHEVEQC